MEKRWQGRKKVDVGWGRVAILSAIIRGGIATKMTIQHKFEISHMDVSFGGNVCQVEKTTTANTLSLVQEGNVAGKINK